MAKTVVGLFENTRDAQRAMQDLEQARFDTSNISFVQNAWQGLGNALMNAGIPEHDVSIYTEGVQQGGALIVLQALPDADAQQAAEILDRYNVVDIEHRGRHASQGMHTDNRERTSTRVGNGSTNLYQGGEVKIPIVEEEIQIGKREVERGGVRVNTRVEEVPVSEQVTVRDEHVDVHRRQVDRPVTDADLSTLEQGSFEVRERDEEVIVDKQARVVEELHVKKEVEERTEQIQDTVRRTDVDVDEISGRSRQVGDRNDRR
jgi:stress response protein YsnF